MAHRGDSDLGDQLLKVAIAALLITFAVLAVCAIVSPRCGAYMGGNIRRFRAAIRNPDLGSLPTGEIRGTYSLPTTRRLETPYEDLEWSNGDIDQASIDSSDTARPLLAKNDREGGSTEGQY